MAENYQNPNGTEVTIPRKTLARLNSDQQAEAIALWFIQYYEDPAQQTPYDGREGGYQYIISGPFNAREEIEEEFSGVAAPEAIEAAISQVEADGTMDWAPSDKHATSIKAREEADEIKPVTYITDNEGNRYVDGEGNYYVHAPDGEGETESTLSERRGNPYSEEYSDEYGFADVADPVAISTRFDAIDSGLAEIRAAIAERRELTLGGDVEYRLRSDLRKAAIELQAQIAQEDEARRGLIGHNQPPEDMRLPMDEAVTVEASDIASVITKSLEGEPPRIVDVVDEVSKLQRIGRYLLKKIDLMLDEAVKSIGKSVGPLMIAGGGALAMHLLGFSELALAWMRAATGL